MTMRSMLIHLCLFATLALGACGTQPANRLFGSAQSTYNLDFDRVEVQRQELGGQFVAIIVSYVKSPDEADRRQLPVKIIAGAPVEANQEKDLTKPGSNVSRVMKDNSQFPRAMSRAVVTFTTLGGANQPVEGKFFVTFDSGSTLNGEFSATLQLLTVQ